MTRRVAPGVRQRGRLDLDQDRVEALSALLERRDPALQLGDLPTKRAVLIAESSVLIPQPRESLTDALDRDHARLRRRRVGVDVVSHHRSDDDLGRTHRSG